MSDQISITSPVRIRGDSPERVALDLASLIATHEERGTKKDTAYWFKLYAQCYQLTVHGWTPSQVAEVK